ncbi:hypothetical protein GCM10009105_37580 [Dokdonella soli]|uniref:Uncharacterized protein n=1 Tax=Dokdonella soli TaxID=529810 RepID=A0ABP3U595_9GAMM
MAGGSVLFHEVAEMLRGGIKTVDMRISPSPMRRGLIAFADARTTPRDVTNACESVYEFNKDDCNKFAKAVAAQFSVPLTGNADAIVDQITGIGWSLTVSRQKCWPTQAC